MPKFRDYWGTVKIPQRFDSDDLQEFLKELALAAYYAGYLDCENDLEELE